MGTNYNNYQNILYNRGICFPILIKLLYLRLSVYKNIDLSTKTKLTNALVLYLNSYKTLHEAKYVFGSKEPRFCDELYRTQMK